MDLPRLSSLDIANKKVILRADLDVDNPNENDQRLKAAAETIKYLSGKDAKVIVVGHRGRPADAKALAGKPDSSINSQLSLKPVCDVLSKISGKDIDFIYDLVGAESHDACSKLQRAQVVCLENLRFDSREESNDPGFAKSLAELGEIYVNEAFASSHREHASIVGIPKLLPHAVGLRFEKEVENLSKVFTNPARPLLFLISGLKKDKLNYVKTFESLADKILIGGRLPEFLEDKALESVRTQTGRVIIGNLVMDKEDITLNTTEKFVQEIEKAKTIVVSGPLGRFEDEGHRQGTEGVFNAVASSNTFKVAGGGDTEDAIRLFGLADKFDWISVGGGAMLDFLATHTLSGIEAMSK